MPATGRPIFVYMTAGSTEQAHSLGRILVEERLAACVNLIDGMHSIYRWEGQVEEASETVLIAKTTAAMLERLTLRVREVHPYECPCVRSEERRVGNEGVSTCRSR